MDFGRKLKELKREEIWNEYCSFLDLSISEYMHIQKRLMEEQLKIFSACGLGQSLLKGKQIHSLQEFREKFPLTTYEDYADILLQKRADMLPDSPIVWIQTTWEGGKHPIKLAPYCKGMLDTYKNNMMTCLMLATSTERGKFDVRPGYTMLYGLAPLPYATGLLPLLLNDTLEVEFLPAVKDAEKMSFSQRNKLGFKMGLKKGIDYFFGMGSVTYFIGKSFSEMTKGKGGKSKKGVSLLQYSPKLVYRYIKAKSQCEKEGRELLPKDVFKLRGFMCAGTDNRCYKKGLEEQWGIYPAELFAGTEPGCLGCDTWARNGLYLFPDACFYEFIPEDEMNKSLEDPSYIPKTYLMDEVVENENYELVISVLKGGAFMRYRVGDVYRCLGVRSESEKINLPRFEYVDRIPTVIDIAGFTRITENTIGQVIRLSNLAIKDWFACKEFNEENHPYMHMYVEMDSDAYMTSAITKEVLKEHLSVYFKYNDGDYKDLKRILGMDPLEITILPYGSFARYEKFKGQTLRHINPPVFEKMKFLQINRLHTGRGGDYYE